MTPKQRRFVELYNGNATEAAIAAGYSRKTARSIGQRILTNVDIAEAIKAREDKELRHFIANREERQRLWTEIMNDPEMKTSDRLRASELLGRSEGDFIERQAVELSGSVNVFSAEIRKELLRLLELIPLLRSLKSGL